MGNFDWKSSEKMLEVGPDYDLGSLSPNSYPVRRGARLMHFPACLEGRFDGNEAAAPQWNAINLKRIPRLGDPAKTHILFN